MSESENNIASVCVSEIFQSLHGESSRAGLPCVLIRLAGCNLSCHWCDTDYAKKSDAGKKMTLDEVLAAVAAWNCPRVELTGGEPLLQPAAGELLTRLCDAGYETLLETNGSLDISHLDSRVRRIVDIKCPASHAAPADDAICWENLDHLHSHDEVKFVLVGREDYEFARRVVSEHRLTHRCGVIFSPVATMLTAADLARWILDDRLDVRLGVQLHKIIWPGEDRGV